MAKYDLAYKSVVELTEDSSAPASGDFLVRYDASATSPKKVDATDLSALHNIGATAAEINNAADVSTWLISIADNTDTLALTAATHANRTIVSLDASLAITLPEATGTGNKYRLVMGIAATAVTIVTADTANAGFYGIIEGYDTDAITTQYRWATSPGASDTVTLNGVATGGKIYDWIEVEDVATDAWIIRGSISQSGGSEATPLSSAA